MELKLIFLSVAFVGFVFDFSESKSSKVKYYPNWKSLDSRPLPTWFDEAKIGIFIHWGVFSVPSITSEWFWFQLQNKNAEVVEFMKKNYPPNFTYQNFAKDFTAALFKPNSWANIFKKSGANYVVLTAKHHEGFTMWPSQYSFGWNAGDIGPKRDLVDDLAKAVREVNLTFGVYHSMMDWYHPLFMEDQANKFQTQKFVRAKAIPELQELVTKYKPEIIWSDGEWYASSKYWDSENFLAWLYNESPVKDTVVVNDRWGLDTRCKHGGYFNCEDKYHPNSLQSHKWENAMSLDYNSWGYRRDMQLQEIVAPEDLIKQVVTTVSCGGNILINFGPTKEGTVPPIFEERLLQLGSWLGVNGEAIYKSHPWVRQNDSIATNAWYTFRPDLNSVYLTIFEWPKKNMIYLENFADLYRPKTKITMLGVNKALVWAHKSNSILIILPNKKDVSTQWAWTFKIAN